MKRMAPSERSPAAAAAPRALVERYRPQDLAVFTPEERRRFLGPIDPRLLSLVDEDPEAWRTVAPKVAWELLYRIEPDLYDRLIAGEHLHPGILGWLPAAIDRAVDVGAGLGRFTASIASRCVELAAIEPAGPLRSRLKSRMDALGHHQVSVRPGFFDALPLPDGWADLTVSCSAFMCTPEHGGDAGLAEMERVTADGGCVVIVWPPRNQAWLAERGFGFVEFPGEMQVEFSSVDEALEIAAIFYPRAVAAIEAMGARHVPYEILGINPPCSLAWRRVAR